MCTIQARDRTPSVREEEGGLGFSRPRFGLLCVLGLIWLFLGQVSAPHAYQQELRGCVNLGSRVISHDYLYINPFGGYPTLLLNRASLQSIRPYYRGNSYEPGRRMALYTSIPLSPTRIGLDPNLDSGT